MENLTLARAAKNCLTSGLSVIATRDKIAQSSWKEFQSSLMPLENVDKNFNNGNGIAVVTGKVSKNLEVIDVDLKYDVSGKLWNDLTELIENHLPGLLNKLTIIKTKNNGRHIYYRCRVIGTNKKLARRKATEEEIKNDPNDKFKVLIETKAEGGYVIAPPSDGYLYENGNLFYIQEIKPEERECLIGICKSFDESPQEVTTTEIESNTPWKEYNQRTNIIKLLESYGWTEVKRDSQRVFLKRPGTTPTPYSGNVHLTHNTFHCFSESTAFDTEHVYKPVEVFALLELNMDHNKINWSTLSKELVNRGYGKQKTAMTKPETKEAQNTSFTLVEISAKDIRRNEITGKLEKAGTILTEQEINSIWINLKNANPEAKGLTKEYYETYLNSNHIDAYNPIKKIFAENENKKPSGRIKSLVECIEPYNELNELFLTKWLVGMCASLYDANYNSLMIVLVGPKNCGKTEFFRRLLPAPLTPYFLQSKFSEGKDSEALMCEAMVILDDELHAMRGREANAIRSSLSAHQFTYRPPYAKLSVTRKRLASLCGTSNDTSIINDPEHNRRIIPIEVIRTNHEKYNSIDKLELIMEAYHLYKSGYDWNLSKSDIIKMEELCEGFEIWTVEEELVAKFYDKNGNGLTVELSATEILQELTEKTHLKLSRVKIGRALSRLGFEQNRKRVNGKVMNVYSLQRSF